MTRVDGRVVTCPNPNCQRPVPTAPPFSKWVRNNRRLDSIVKCLTVSDCDYIFHKWAERLTPKKVDASVMYLMTVEAKSFGKPIEKWQREMLAMQDDCVRTTFPTQRRPNGTFAPNHETNARQIYSLYQGRTVMVINYGFHVLTMSGDDPETSDLMTWEDPRGIVKRDITPAMLEKLLLFEVNPDSLQPMVTQRRKPVEASREDLLPLGPPKPHNLDLNQRS